VMTLIVSYHEEERTKAVIWLKIKIWGPANYLPVIITARGTRWFNGSDKPDGEMQIRWRGM
jgi:hypothetical protein